MWDFLGAWSVVFALLIFALLIAVWIRFFPTREDLREFGPASRAIGRIAWWVTRPLRALGSRAFAFVSPYLQVQQPSPWAGWDSLERAPEGIAVRTAALGRIHRMNGEGGDLSLPASDSTSGALTIDDGAGALSVSKPKSS